MVALRDRLCRFAFDLLETVFKSHGVRLVVHGQEDGGRRSCNRDELAEDLLPSSTSSSPETTDAEQHQTNENDKNKKEKKDLVAKKIKLELTPKQRATLRRWCGVYRWTYNECVRLCCIAREVKYCGKNKTIKELRSRVVNSKSSLVKERPWVRQVPYDVRDGAIIEFVKNPHDRVRKAQTNPAHIFRLEVQEPKMDSQPGHPRPDRKHWKDGGAGSMASWAES